MYFWRMCALAPQAMDLLPASTAVSDVIGFLESVLEEFNKNKRDTQVLKSLLYAENLQVTSTSVRRRRVVAQTSRDEQRRRVT